MAVHLYRKLIAVFIAVVMLGAVAAPGSFAVSGKTLDSAYDKTKDMIVTIGDASGWNEESAWIVLGLARAGELNKNRCKKYRSSILTLLKKNDSAVLNEKQASDNARAVIALTACGYDAANIGGYDLTEPFADYSYVIKQGINGPIWALIALDSYDYEIPQIYPENRQNTRDRLISSILSAQKKDNGWAFSGNTSDVDMTCMALQALAPYYSDDDKCRNAVDKALSWLSSVQKRNGNFESGKIETSESSSQATVALTALKIKLLKDSRFIKNNKSVVDSLMSFYVDGGGFKHQYSNYKANNMATIQAYYALVAYYRYKDGCNSLYSMTDRDSGYRIKIDPGKDNGQDDNKHGNDQNDNNDRDKSQQQNNSDNDRNETSDDHSNPSDTEKNKNGSVSQSGNAVTKTVSVKDDEDNDSSKDKEKSKEKTETASTGSNIDNTGTIPPADQNRNDVDRKVSGWLYVIIAAAAALALIVFLRMRVGKGS